jgi:hypothetical protein
MKSFQCCPGLAYLWPANNQVVAAYAVAVVHGDVARRHGKIQHLTGVSATQPPFAWQNVYLYTFQEVLPMLKACGSLAAQTMCLAV